MEEILILKEPVGLIKSAKDLFLKIDKFKLNFKQENMIVFYLDTKQTLIKSEILFKGGLNSCIVDLRTLFRNALINNANSIILAHNHPSGNLEPSTEDLNIREKTNLAGKIIGINLLDFIVFNEKEFYAVVE